MVTIHLKDGKEKQFESNVALSEAAKAISNSLGKEAVVAKVDGELTDLRDPIVDGTTVEFFTKKDTEGLFTLRHTAAHVMAQAIQHLYPGVKFAIGPAIDDGFYYDIDSEHVFSQEDFDAIEREMAKISKENIPLVKKVLPRAEALEFFKEKNQDYKVMLIEDLPEDAVISLYEQGDFTDLCAGPHMKATGKVKVFKLMTVAGAYWRGDEHNKMLQRIYATAFFNKEDLEHFLFVRAEAEKRDHRKLGKQLDLFSFHEEGPGFPFFHPKGMVLRNQLMEYERQLFKEFGYVEIMTPVILSKKLWIQSGHWDHYKDGMFVLGDEEKDDEVFALRPMTCPFQYQAYLNKSRSYRDLPLRYNETSTLFRNEASGEMHGLIRVRQFTISEGHLMCTPEQLEDEFKGCLELAIFMLKTVGLYEDVSYRFSQWDPDDREKYIGTPEQWAEAQGVMQKILDHLGLDYAVGVGEAAFYGPKLDIQIKNVHGKEDTLITIQIDQMLAEKFGMEYTDKDGAKKNPYIIHRTSIGCYERTLAYLIEKYAGALPLWMMPTQVRVLPITDRAHDYAQEIVDRLRDAGIRAESDYRSEKLGYKIREAQMQKIPYMLVVGDRDMENQTVSVRTRAGVDLGAMSVDDFRTKCRAEIDTKVRD